MKFVGLGFGLSFSLLAAYSPAVAQSDTEPPTLTAFDFNPKSVDVTNGPATVISTLSAHDALSGVAGLTARFYSPSGAQSAFCGYSAGSDPEADPTWSCSASIAQYAESGIWMADVISVQDAAGNFRFYSTSELSALGLPTQLQVTSNPDIVAPTLTAFDFNPKSVDVTNGPATVISTLSAHDALSGVAGLTARFYSPSGAQSAFCGYSAGSDPEADPTWSCSASIAQYAESGIWMADVISVQDAAGNFRFYSTSELSALGLPTQLQVTSNPDIVAPTLTAFDFNPKSVDVTNGPATVISTLSAHDALSGVAGLTARFYSPSGAQSAFCGYSAGSDPEADPTWSCSASIAQYAESGIWMADVISVQDAAGNFRFYSHADLAHLQFPAELHVCSDHLGRDTDADGWGDDCDNCPATYNTNQFDGDADGVGVVCDVCPADYDPSQTDFDHDGEGDRCDLNDGLILIYSIDKDYIDWQNEAGPNAWNAYQGDLGVLRSAGVYTQQPSSNPLADRRCHVNLNYTDNFIVPAPGFAQFSLVTGMTGSVEGSLGGTSGGVPRANANPCP